MFLCSKLPCLGWRSADFFQVFFTKNVCWTSANLHVQVLRFLWTKSGPRAGRPYEFEKKSPKIFSELIFFQSRNITCTFVKGCQKLRCIRKFTKTAPSKQLPNMRRFLQPGHPVCESADWSLTHLEGKYGHTYGTFEYVPTYVMIVGSNPARMHGVMYEFVHGNVVTCNLMCLGIVTSKFRWWKEKLEKEREKNVCRKGHVTCVQCFNKKP
jgi:hypothetical protein